MPVSVFSNLAVNYFMYKKKKKKGCLNFTLLRKLCSCKFYVSYFDIPVPFILQKKKSRFLISNHTNEVD